jgi:hypothetical protein
MCIRIVSLFFVNRRTTNGVTMLIILFIFACAALAALVAYWIARLKIRANEAELLAHKAYIERQLALRREKL